MGWLWDDRLAETWADPGRAGAGVVVGPRAVLTARHVIAMGGGRILGRIVRPGHDTPRWSSMRVVWDDQEWDLALLSVDEGSAGWMSPSSRPPVVVRPGSAALRHCEAVGFPDSQRQRTGSSRPADAVRNSEQLLGSVLPAGQAKRPVAPTRRLPRRWMPLDVDTARPASQEGWKGMSGAGVVAQDGRLVGIVVAAESGRDLRRLYVVPLAEALSEAAGLAAVMQRAGGPAVAEALEAPAYRAALENGCLGADGLPLRVAEVTNLDVFGVKPIRHVAGTSHRYLDYVLRDTDPELDDALDEASGGGRRFVRITGESAAGKSRAAAEAVLRHGRLSHYRFLRPRRDGGLRRLTGSRLDLRESVVWLDDVHNYVAGGLNQTLVDELLSHPDLIIVATISHGNLQAFGPSGDIFQILANDNVTRPVTVQSYLSERESRIARQLISDPELIAALDGGAGLGEWLIAGRELIRWYKNGSETQQAIVLLAADWQLTGLSRPLPLPLARRLCADYLDPGTRRTYQDLPEGKRDQYFDRLRAWAARPVVDQTVREHALVPENDAGLVVNDYVMDHLNELRYSAPDWDSSHWIPYGLKQGSPALWQAAFDIARAAAEEDGQTSALRAVGSSAIVRGPAEVARSALTLLADAGDAQASSNLGLFLSSEGEESEAVRRFEQACQQGNTMAMLNLGLHLDLRGEEEQAYRWLAEAAARGDKYAVAAMGSRASFHQGRGDFDKAMRWWERAAAHGDQRAAARLAEMRQLSVAEMRQVTEEEHQRSLGRALLAFAQRHHENGDLEGERHYLNEAAARGEPEAMFKLANLHYQQGDLGETLRWLERAIEYGHEQAGFQLAVCLYEWGEHAQAREWLHRAAAQRHPDAVKWMGWFGSYHYRNGRLEEAASWWRQAAADGDLEALANLGALYTRRGEFDDAMRALEQAADNGIPAAMYNLAVLHVERGDPAMAGSWLEAAADHGIEIPYELMTRLGSLHQQRGELAEANAWFERAADHPEAISKLERMAASYRAAGDRQSEAGTLNNLGATLSRSGRFHEAIGALREAAAIYREVAGNDHPDTLASLFNLARAYQNAGLPDAAISLYERMLDDCERVLGAEHPATQTLRSELAHAKEPPGT